MSEPHPPEGTGPLGEDPEEEPAVRIEDFTAPPEAAGMRLDTFLGRHFTERSRTFYQYLIKENKVLVNGLPAKRSATLEGGERIRLEIPPPESPWPQAQDIPIEILYDDDEIAVVNKAAGMVVHPAAGNPDGTLVNALLYRFPDLPGINGVKRPGLVHRLDRDTSGVMVVAKTDRAMRHLTRQIANRTMSRLYIALVIGDPDWRETSVEASIGRHPVMRVKRMVEGEGARSAVTHFRVLARAQGFTLLECKLETGRTHQIRVHCAHIGMPIAGDTMYGGTEARALEKLRHADSDLRNIFRQLKRPFLHARRLHFRHPARNHWRKYTAPLPEDLLSVLRVLFPHSDPEALLASPEQDRLSD